MSLFLLSQPLHATDFTEHPAKGKQYETFMVHFAKNLGFENPFDLISNRVELRIVQPDFTRRNLSFFYDGTNAQGREQWEARFAPKQSQCIHLLSPSMEKNTIALQSSSIQTKKKTRAA